MKPLSYRAVFTGKLLQGRTLDQVIHTLFERRILSQAACRELKEGRQVVLGDDLSATAAAALQHAFEMAGAVLVLEDSVARLSAPHPSPAPRLDTHARPEPIPMKPIRDFATKLRGIRHVSQKLAKLPPSVLIGVPIIIFILAILLGARLVSPGSASDAVTREDSFGGKERQAKPKHSKGRFDPKQIYTLASTGYISRIVVSINQPKEVTCCLPVHAQDMVIRPSDGRIIYLDTETDTVRLFEPDDYVWNKEKEQWMSPENAKGNDPIIVEEGNCPGSTIDELIVGPGINDLIVECRGAHPLYLDSRGKEVNSNFRKIVAIGQDRLMLTQGSTLGPSESRPGRITDGYFLLNQSGNETHLRDWKYSAFRIHNHEQGFRFLVMHEIPRGTLLPPEELWFVDQYGNITKQGDYPDLIHEYGQADYLSHDYDSSGNLFTRLRVRKLDQWDMWEGIFTRELFSPSARLYLSGEKERYIALRIRNLNINVVISEFEPITGP